MDARLEHANLTVRDPEAMIRFLTTAFPHFRVRGRGSECAGHAWVHVGDDVTYLSLLTAPADASGGFAPYSGSPGLNHLGFEVPDALALQRRLEAAGYRETTVANDHPHRIRVYFADPEGNDWEFVEYRSERTAERNDYALPDLGAREEETA